MTWPDVFDFIKYNSPFLNEETFCLKVKDGYQESALKFIFKFNEADLNHIKNPPPDNVVASEPYNVIRNK